MRVAALVPAYQAAAHLGEVLLGLQALAEPPDVLVVDDGSRDATAAVARQHGARVLSFAGNRGKGYALIAGFQALADYDGVVTLDADGQHDPAEIPLFVAKFRATAADLIIGERDFSQMPLVRKVSNTFGRGAFSWAIGRKVRDNQSGYRLLSRRLMEAVLSSGERGFEFEMEMIVVCVKRGWPIEGVPIRTIYGEEVSNIKPMQHVVHFLRMVRQTRRAMRAK